MQRGYSQLGKIKLFFALFLCLTPVLGVLGFTEVTEFSQNEQTVTFSMAKTLAKEIHADHRLTFYCGCRYDKYGKIDLKTCGYKIQKNKKRAERIEWEHIVPVSLWGQALPCWRQALCCDSETGRCYKGRKCCEKVDPQFIKMETDLHNVVPEIGELNAYRSNYRFGMLPFVSQGQFGTCEIKIDQETRRVEPSVAVRGTIARAYLYMSETYDIPLSSSQEQLFRAWNREYPPTAWEKTWHDRVAEIQGSHNPFILRYAEKRGD